MAKKGRLNFELWNYYHLSKEGFWHVLGISGSISLPVSLFATIVCAYLYDYIFAYFFHSQLLFFLCLSIFLFLAIFWVVLFGHIFRFRGFAEDEKIKAEDTEKNRTDTYRRNYVVKHKDEILKRADDIKRKHEELIINTTKKKYFDKFVSREVYKMWDEEYLLWEMADSSDLDEVYKKHEDQPQRKKTNRELMQEEFEELKARIVMEKLTIQDVRIILTETTKEWSKEFGAEASEEMFELLQQRAKQYFSTKGL